MLSQIQRLCQDTEGRYASDEELAFLTSYARSFEVRVQTYQKIQVAEPQIIQQSYTKLNAADPTFFQRNKNDVTKTCKRDATITLRYCATAMLIDDADSLRENYLFWGQTVNRAFGGHCFSGEMYRVMQDVIKDHLAPAQVNLLQPLLETSRRILGTA
jgi:hypothetical protein